MNGNCPNNSKILSFGRHKAQKQDEGFFEFFKRGFTLIELLVVMAIIATLLSIVAPRYFHQVSRAQEATLKQNLAVMRDALDKYHADTGHWPETLEELVEKKYIRAVPQDPITESFDTWQIDSPPEGGDGIYDIHSGANGQTEEGIAYGNL